MKLVKVKPITDVKPGERVMVGTPQHVQFTKVYEVKPAGNGYGVRLDCGRGMEVEGEGNVLILGEWLG